MNYRNILTDAVISNEDYNKLSHSKRVNYIPTTDDVTHGLQSRDRINDEDDGLDEAFLGAVLLSSLADDCKSGNFETADTSSDGSSSNSNNDFGGFGGGDSGGGGADNDSSSSDGNW